MDDRPIRALLVDDDEDDFVMTRDMLADSSRGAPVVLDWVSTYEEGLELVGTQDHDVYLIDYRLGGHSGLDLLKAAIEGGCRAPVIVLTGQGDHDIDMMAMEAGATDYLVKGQVDSALLERSLRYAIERRKVDQLRDSLVGLASQELRTPIMSVRDRAQAVLLEDTAALSDATVEHLGSIIQAAGHLTRLIDGFLDVARIDSGRQIELTVDALDIRGLIDEAIEIQTASCGGCLFALTCPDGLPLLHADRYKLLLVLIGLLSAAESRAPGGTTVGVVVSRAPGHVRFAIHDEGDAPADRLRDELVRPGSGLHLARHLVEAHDGAVSADSEAERGTTVTFTIPMQ